MNATFKNEEGRQPFRDGGLFVGVREALERRSALGINTSQTETRKARNPMWQAAFSDQ